MQKSKLIKGLHLVVTIAMLTYFSSTGMFLVNSASAAATAPPQPIDNPPLGDSCGLDIALVIDGSGSINSTEYGQMQTAFNGFVDAFLPGTPTEMSVVEFATGSIVRQGFTNNETTLKNEIDEPRVKPDGGMTNWEQGLLSTHGLFPNRNNTDLIIFASDSNPNRKGNPATSGGALDAAIVAANTIKADGIHIMALGIGSSVDITNMEKISGPGDVITSDFDTLADDLATLAKELCGGTITVQKLIDGQPTADWEFTPTVRDGTSSPVSALTDSNGQALFTINFDEVTTVDIAETLQIGYDLTAASCTSGIQAVGSFDNIDSVDEITIGHNDIISCTFENTFVAICGDGVVNQDSEECDGTDGIIGEQTCSENCMIIEPEVKTPNLAISKTVNESLVNPADTLSYTVTVSNFGEGDAENVTLNDLLPAGLTFADKDGLNSGDTEKSWTWEMLAAGEDVTVTYDVLVDSKATDKIYENVATVSAENFDGNVSDSAVTEVKIPVVLGETAPSLTISKSVLDTTFANPGETVTYEIIITNDGTAVAMNVILKDVLPAGFVFADNSETTATWNPGDLVPSESFTKTYDVRIDASIIAGKYVNIASVQADDVEKITDSASLEIREIQVLGAEVDEEAVLPVTGGGLAIIVAGWALMGLSVVATRKKY